MISACSLFDNDDSYPCKEISISTKLTRVLYWGEVDPENWKPNQGIPISSIRYPVWISQNKLLVSTGTLTSGQIIEGIFEIEIDPANFQFVKYTPYEFSNSIWTIRYDRNQSRPMIIYIDELSQSHAAYVSFSDNQTFIDDEIIGKDWDPQALLCWPGKSGIVFYGKNPDDGVRGFYWHYQDSTGTEQDSLLYRLSINRWTARGSSISNDGKYLFFGIVEGPLFSMKTLVFKLDISQPNQNPTVILERKGEFIFVSPNPIDSDQLLINYHFRGSGGNPPRGHIELINLKNSEAIDLNVRTTKYSCLYITSHTISWSADGLNFAFSSYEINNYGLIASPLELWVYHDVP